MNFEKSILQLAEQIQYVRNRPIQVPATLNIDLSVPLVDQEFSLTGNLFYVWSAPDESSYINVRLNNTASPAIPFTLHTGINTPFEKLYITTPAGQTGTMQILYGGEAPNLLDVIDNRTGGVFDELRGDLIPENWGTEITVGNAAAVQILAANAARKGCCIQAKAVNTGIVYIGFDNSVATNKWVVELQAGMSFTVDDYRGDLYARASAVGQLVGYGEW